MIVKSTPEVILLVNALVFTVLAIVCTGFALFSSPALTAGFLNLNYALLFALASFGARWSSFVVRKH